MNTKNGAPGMFSWWKIALVVGALIALAAVLVMARSKPEAIKSEGGGVYFEGVRWNRNTGKWVDGNGKVVPKPEGMPDPATPDPGTRLAPP
jgi:hypothetical protein